MMEDMAVSFESIFDEQHLESNYVESLCHDSFDRRDLYRHAHARGMHGGIRRYSIQSG